MGKERDEKKKPLRRLFFGCRCGLLLLLIFFWSVRPARLFISCFFIIFSSSGPETDWVYKMTKSTSRGVKREREEEGEEFELDNDSALEDGVHHYLTFKDGGSDKFYEISVAGHDVLCRYGRAGNIVSDILYQP